jgi:beta-lactamase regulating signal transducer with metallopeptidase domain
MIAALLDHLWQSTLFLGCAALLTLMLRRNPARIRYRLWLAASLKFLLPFSLLIKLGGALAIPLPAIAMPVTGLALVGDTAMPFAASLPRNAASVQGFDPLILLAALWLFGFSIVFFIWCARLRRIHTALKDSASFSLAAPIPVRVTRAPLGPGLFGIFRPVLLLPEGITKELTERELRAVLDHELCHLERNDNFTAAIHMAVEALFWFHPLVWWLGARLIAERERACDESVVETGNDAGTYAEGILKVCRFYAMPPPLAAGVLSADLEERLAGIMVRRGRAELRATQKALIGAAAMLAIAWPVMTGWTEAARDEFARSTGSATSSGAAKAVLSDRHIAQMKNLEAFEHDADLWNEDTTSKAGCESHFLALLQVLERSYGKFAPLYPQRVRNDQDQLPMSLTWKNGLGASRYQEATVYMSAETAHVWDARGGHVEAAAAWSAKSESADSVCLTEVDVRA